MPLFLTKKEVVHKPYGQSLGHLASFYLFITYTLRNLKSKSKIKVIFALSTSSFRREHTRLLRSILCFFTKAFHRVRFKLTQWMKQLFLTKLLNLGLGHTVINHADGVCGYSEPHKIKIPHGSLRFVTFKVTMLLLCGTGSSWKLLLYLFFITSAPWFIFGRNTISWAYWNPSLWPAFYHWKERICSLPFILVGTDFRHLRRMGSCPGTLG